MFKQLTETFQRPSVEVLAQRELDEARRDLLAAQSAMEYAAAMVDYHTSRIQRLDTMLVSRKVMP